jgi:adenine specific DNA methylase Mod
MAVRAELLWEGKYDTDNRRVAPLRVALPFQTVETINESAQDRQKTFAQHLAQAQPWRNRLIWGDKKYVLPSLLAEFAGKVNLIYIDPPFDTGADFSFTATVPGSEDNGEAELAFTKQPSIIEQKAYRDTWGRGLDSYLQWFYETAALLYELIHETGGLYVHLDGRMVHYVKILLDEVFGVNNLECEIIWKRRHGHSNANTIGIIHDTILFYRKGKECTWNPQYLPYDQDYIDTYYKYQDGDGRRFLSRSMTGHKGVNKEFEWKGFVKPWRYSLETLARLEKEGRIFWTRNGEPRYKQYLDEMPGNPIQSLWTDLKLIDSWSAEAVGYPTQKPEALLERIIKASSNEGDLVLDCFVGSGTTAAVAEKLNRSWIACDLSRFAIHTTRKRLLSISGVRPFVVENLGKYERQLWQTGQFAKDGPETADEVTRRHRAYVEFILQLYHATPVHG